MNKEQILKYLKEQEREEWEDLTELQKLGFEEDQLKVQRARWAVYFELIEKIESE